MKPTQAIMAVTSQFIKEAPPEFSVGDTVRISVRVVEGTRERIQVFEGVVMRRRNGGINENFTVRRIAAHGIGVERTFLLNSPRIDKIEVVRRGVVRRAQLYYLRGLTGKAARIKERRYRPVDKATRRAAALAAAEAAALAPVAEVPTDDVADEAVTEIAPDDTELADTELADTEAVDSTAAADDTAEPTTEA